MFPIAALLTGALLTIGVAVLLVVVLALKKNREQAHQNDGTKEKHIGMDITVTTTPLEMNVGHQQKYVVAYTLKQGVEKQPDILNAQKTSINNIDCVQKMSSPAAIRPDALFSTTSLSASSKQTKINNSFDYQQKSTPSSHQSTLKRNDDSNKSYMPLNQTITSNYNTQPPPYCSTMMMNDYETPLNYTYSSTTSGTSNLPNTTNNNSFHKMSPEYNNLNNMFNNNNATAVAAAAAAASNNHNLTNEQLTNEDGFLEYERTTLDHRLGNSISCENAEALNQSNNGLIISSEQQRYSGSDYANDTMDYKNLANQIANTISNINSTLNRSRNRNHIITDALPGPESCV
ncbi:unnamed protein product [Diamesa serratosioi]